MPLIQLKLGRAVVVKQVILGVFSSVNQPMYLYHDLKAFILANG